MSHSLQSSIVRRRYRLAQALTIAGALSIGMLVVGRMVAMFRSDFFLFYGVSDADYHAAQVAAASHLPLTVTQFLIASLTFVAVCVFVAGERLRLRRREQLSRACDACRDGRVVEQTLRGEALFDAFIMRTTLYAGVLLGLWLLQSSLERRLGGLGWGMQYADWHSLLPLASIFGVCVLAALVVAAVSVVGLRALIVLEIAFAHVIAPRVIRRTRTIARWIPAPAVHRPLRDLIGCDILSRPPPVRLQHP